MRSQILNLKHVLFWIILRFLTGDFKMSFSIYLRFNNILMIQRRKTKAVVQTDVFFIQLAGKESVIVKIKLVKRTTNQTNNNTSRWMAINALNRTGIIIQASHNYINSGFHCTFYLKIIPLANNFSSTLLNRHLIVHSDTS